MVAPVRERPPEVARAGRFDPLLIKAIGWSLAGHVFVVAAALLLALYAPAPTIFEAPPGGPVVDLVTPRGDSKVFKVGPLAKASGVKGSAPKPVPPKPEPPKAEPKPEPPKPEPPKAEPKPEPPKPEPPKVEPPKVEPKPTAIPEPKKPEPPKVEPKPEPKKPEPKPEPKKPEPKPEPKKPEPKPEPKKPEPAKPEPKPEPKAEPKSEPKPEPPKAAAAKPEPSDTKPVVGDPNAGSSKAGATSSGGGSSTEAGPSGDPNGGGGGAGNRSPEFYAYFGYMYRTIKEQWVWVGEQDSTLAATVRFSILADGTIADARITERSRNTMYDESALKAVRATGKLIPPPPIVKADFEDVELVFQAGDLMQP